MVGDRRMPLEEALMVDHSAVAALEPDLRPLGVRSDGFGSIQLSNFESFSLSLSRIMDWLCSLLQQT